MALTDYEKQELVHNMERDKQQKEVAEKLGLMVNSFNRDYNSFFRGIESQHRTLQQAIGCVLFKLIRQYGEHYDHAENKYFDARNEQFGAKCKEINNFMQEKYGEYWDSMSCI